jgi:hypothetical protein
MSDPPPPTVEEELPESTEEAGEADDALILWMLSLTPEKRLEVAQGFVDSIQALRNGRSA